MARLAMQRNDLCNELRQKYQDGMACGVAKVEDPDYANLWFVVPPKPPVKLSKKPSLESLSLANRVIDQLPNFDQMDEIDKLIAYLFVRREALFSSRMEGTWSTIDHVLSPDNSLVDDTKLQETRSIRGYAEGLEQTYQLVHTKKHRVIDLSLLKNLHETFAKKDPNFRGRPGELRAPGQAGSVVYIGGLGRKESSSYNPCPPQYVDKSLKDVLAWFQDDLVAEMGDVGMGLPLVIRMAIGHAHFEAVHPFSDGNGRVGRMLWPIQMILANKAPLYLSGFVEIEKDEYNKRLNYAQKKLDYNPFIEFLCEAFHASYEESQLTKNTLLGLPQEWSKRGNFRKGSTAAKGLNIFLRQPIITIEQLAEASNTSFRAALSAMNKLEKCKIVKERTKRERSRVYAVEEVISLLSRPFGSDPQLALEQAFKKLGLG